MSDAPPVLNSAAAPTVKTRAAVEPGLRFIEAFVWPFESPKWFLNVLLPALISAFLWVVGQIVVTGYLFECLEDQLRTPRFGYRDFELNRFVEYMKRGVFAWLAYFLCSMLGVGLAMMVYFPLFFTAVGLIASGDEVWKVAGGFLLALAYLVYFTLLIIVSVAPTPFILRVGLTQNLREFAEWRWALSFLRKLLPELVLSVMVTSVCMLPFAFLSVLICIIGPIVLTGLYYLIGLRILQQLYELFLARGGEPIPLPVRPAPDAAAVAAEKSSPFAPVTG